MATPPTLHTFDPHIAGMVGLQVDPPATPVGQVIFYVSNVSGGPYSMANDVTVGSGRDGLRAAFDADATTRYYVAKAQDSAGYSGLSNEVSAAGSAGPPPPPPPLTQVQHLQAALGGAYDPGDVVEVFPPTPTVSKTVQADGSIA